MTATLASPTAAAALPTAATTRVKPLDPEELMAVAQTIAAEQHQAQAAQQAALQAQAAQQAEAQARAAAAARVQAEAQARAFGTATTTTPAATTTLAPATSTTTPAATTARATTRTTAAATTTTAARTSGAVAIPSSRVAPRTAHDYWTKHIAQFKGKYLPDGPTMRPNCGPASVTMALRMIGLDIPGFAGQRSEAVLDKARVMATGRNDVTVGTTDTELERLISGSGGQWSESTNFSELTSWVKQGIPVVLSGNPAYGWNHRYNSKDVFPFNGGHWVTVSGYDASTGHYIVNDPLSQIGPIYVSEAELRNYNKAHGNLGIAVFR